MLTQRGHGGGQPDRADLQKHDWLALPGGTYLTHVDPPLDAGGDQRTRFVQVGGDAQAGGGVVVGAQRQNAKRGGRADQALGHRGHRAVAARGDHELAALLRRAARVLARDRLLEFDASIDADAVAGQNV